MPACGAPMSWAMRSTAPTAACAECWQIAINPMSWRFAVPTPCVEAGIVGSRRHRPRNSRTNSRPWTSDRGFEHWLLVRRKRSKSAEKAYYLVFAPPGTALAELAAVAGLRWAVEECFERAKDDLGLDHCEARSWHGWHRHMSLCMAALIPSVPEIRYLLARILICPPTRKPFILAWSLWRRRHQATATICHYKRRTYMQL